MNIFRDVSVLCYLKVEKPGRTGRGRNPSSPVVIPRTAGRSFTVTKIKHGKKQMDFYEFGVDRNHLEPDGRFPRDPPPYPQLCVPLRSFLHV